MPNAEFTMFFQRFSLSLLIIVGLAGCVTTGEPDEVPSHDNTDAVFWLQSSSEYAALTTGVYAAATVALKDIAASGDAGSMAIVLDVDETVLDNSP